MEFWGSTEVKVKVSLQAWPGSPNLAATLDNYLKIN
jgi:hypothetical protein